MEPKETEETGTPLFDEAEFAPDPNQPVFVEPGSITETGEVANEGTKSGDGSDAAESTTEPSGAERPDADVVPDVPKDQPEPVTVEDPGDFTPKDYSFDVTIYDEEGRNGKTVHVSNVEQYEQLLEADSNFGSAASLMKAQRMVTRMETNNDRDQQDFDTKKALYDSSVESAESRANTLNQWQAEADYLMASGELPAMEAGDKDANWSDPEIAAKPGVKAQIELLNYMNEENGRRTTAGIAPLTSLNDAFNAMELKRLRDAGNETKQRLNQARKNAGAKVAGTQPNPVAAPPKGVMVGRSYGDLSNMGSYFGNGDS